MANDEGTEDQESKEQRSDADLLEARGAVQKAMVTSLALTAPGLMIMGPTIIDALEELLLRRQVGENEEKRIREGDSWQGGLKDAIRIVNNISLAGMNNPTAAALAIREALVSLRDTGHAVIIEDRGAQPTKGEYGVETLLEYMKSVHARKTKGEGNGQ